MFTALRSATMQPVSSRLLSRSAFLGTFRDGFVSDLQVRTNKRHKSGGLSTSAINKEIQSANTFRGFASQFNKEGGFTGDLVTRMLDKKHPGSHPMYKAACKNARCFVFIFGEEEDEHDCAQACYHYHMALECSFKALLQQETGTHPHTHSLMKLTEKLEDVLGTTNHPVLDASIIASAGRISTCAVSEKYRDLIKCADLRIDIDALTPVLFAYLEKLR